jgi:hypothetical protein
MTTTIHIQHNGEMIPGHAIEVPHRQHNMYKVIFQNGYENVFYTDVETGEWIEEDLGFTQLATQIGKQIKATLQNPYHVPKLLTWHKQVNDNRVILFGFFNYMKGHHKMYEIYDCRSKYLYTLVEMEEDNWQILGNTNVVNGNIDTLFVQMVTRILPLYSSNI